MSRLSRCETIKTPVREGRRCSTGEHPSDSAANSDDATSRRRRGVVAARATDQPLVWSVVNTHRSRQMDGRLNTDDHYSAAAEPSSLSDVFIPLKTITSVQTIQHIRYSSQPSINDDLLLILL